MKVLITGGTGSLGQDLVRAVSSAGDNVRVMSRRPGSQAALQGVELVQADIASGEGVRSAVSGVDAILHAASDPRRAEAVDVTGTRRLVEAARASGVAHIVYVSIVGVDEIPVGYYRRKMAAEEIIRSSGAPYTIMRATQFHSFVASLLTKAARCPLVMPLPAGFKFQSVEESEVAERLAECLARGPRGRVEDFGGPEVLPLVEMAEAWMRAKRVSKRLFNLPLPGAAARALRAGRNTAPGAAKGVVSWQDWLTRDARHAVNV